MFLAEVEGGLTNDHQAQGWNVGVVEMMVIQSLEDNRNLNKSKIVVFVTFIDHHIDLNTSIRVLDIPLSNGKLHHFFWPRE